MTPLGWGLMTEALLSKAGRSVANCESAADIFRLGLLGLGMVGNDWGWFGDGGGWLGMVEVWILLGPVGRRLRLNRWLGWYCLVLVRQVSWIGCVDSCSHCFVVGWFAGLFAWLVSCLG